MYVLTCSGFKSSTKPLLAQGFSITAATETKRTGSFAFFPPSIKVLSVISTLVVVEITSTFVVSSVILISVESEGDSTVRILIWGVKSKEVLLNAEPENDISILVSDVAEINLTALPGIRIFSSASFIKIKQFI